MNCHKAQDDKSLNSRASARGDGLLSCSGVQLDFRYNLLVTSVERESQGVLMLRFLAVLAGIAFIFIGVSGFLPTFITNHLLYGFFEISPLHNIVYIVSGVIAIMAATSIYSTQLYFKLFGIIYTLFAIVGFWRGNLYLMNVNLADNILHIVIGVIALLLGFVVSKTEST